MDTDKHSAIPLPSPPRFSESIRGSSYELSNTKNRDFASDAVNS